MGEDGGGRPGTTRVMSHGFSLAGTEGPSAKTIVPYSPSSPYPPGRSPSYHPQKDGLRAIVRPVLPRGRTDWTVENTALAPCHSPVYQIVRYKPFSLLIPMASSFLLPLPFFPTSQFTNTPLNIPPSPHPSSPFLCSNEAGARIDEQCKGFPMTTSVFTTLHPSVQ